MNKKTILLDVDDVVCFSGYLEAVNAFLNTNYVIDDFSEYYIDATAIPKDRYEEFNNFMKNWNLYDNPNILPGAIDTIKKLNEYYDIYICSSCINPFNVNGSGKLFYDKYNFLVNTLPFINPDKFIFTNSKNIIKADIQIDDRLVNLNNDIETKILFPAYHNKNISNTELDRLGVIRAGYDWRYGWLEVNNILLSEYNKNKCSTKKLKIER